jgi:hypothetical protein
MEDDRVRNSCQGCGSGPLAVQVLSMLLTWRGHVMDLQQAGVEPKDVTGNYRGELPGASDGNGSRTEP